VFGFENNFLVKLPELRFYDGQDFTACAGQPVILACAASATGMRPAPEPAQAFHPVQERIECAGTDFITVSAQLSEYPLAADRLLIRMMQNVNLPKAEQYFPVERFHPDPSKLRLPKSLAVINLPGQGVNHDLSESELNQRVRFNR
jgi:hypothetical protein